ncbi:hypothetical protein [Psychrobacter sp. CAL346-MNA-CIBAN-0220]|uniref:hypothetical protein n=1 Tax=Psychrobacter sp. CAL346-MNA-CIBAN-0220 TaxID=3140457 RepID=UPI0033212C53
MIRNLSFTLLYTPLAGEHCLSSYGFFLIDDGWDEKTLIDLKHKTGARLLLGLQTSDKGIDEFDVIDGIIICQPAEVEQVIGVFKSVLERRTVIDTPVFYSLEIIDKPKYC